MVSHSVGPRCFFLFKKSCQESGWVLRELRLSMWILTIRVTWSWNTKMFTNFANVYKCDLFDFDFCCDLFAFHRLWFVFSFWNRTSEKKRRADFFFSGNPGESRTSVRLQTVQTNTKPERSGPLVAIQRCSTRLGWRPRVRGPPRFPVNTPRRARFCHGKENGFGSSKHWMGHKDKIRPTSLKCRISKIPNSQICAFLHQEHERPKHRGQRGSACFATKATQFGSVWCGWTLDFHAMGFFIALMMLQLDSPQLVILIFWRMTKRRKREAEFKWQVLAEMNRRSLESSQKKTQSSWFRLMYGLLSFKDIQERPSCHLSFFHIHTVT